MIKHKTTAATLWDKEDLLTTDGLSFQTEHLSQVAQRFSDWMRTTRGTICVCVFTAEKIKAVIKSQSPVEVHVISQSKMHGRLKVKTSKEQEEERKVKEREKAYHFENLKNRLFDLRPQIGNIQDHEEILTLTTELLLINPDFYTVWNIRRETLLAHVEKNNVDEKEEKVGDHKVPDNANQTWEKELLFTRDCLAKNEKSYSVWQHRIWVLLRMPKSAYETEIKICNAFLERDERNFHCWDYRSYICDTAKIDIEKEFQFTTDKINSECLNFSAWHRRHKLLCKGLAMAEDLCPKSVNLRLIWPDEYDMILKAVFIEPSDQAPWPYHNWLVKNNFGHLGQEQIDKLKELQELEQDNKLVARAIELAERYRNPVK